MLASVKALFSSIVDYAGLFPPAKLGMKEAIANYAQYQMTCYNWMLGRFVLPTSRLNEFEELLPKFSLEDSKTRQWSLSAIVSGDWKLEIEKVQSFNSKDQIAITALEFPMLLSTEIERVIPRLPAGVDAFFEIPFSEDLEAYLAVLQGTNVSAKIRTGGITADAFPSMAQLCRFILACADARLPFKATAGLHHPLPAKHPLTSKSDSPSTVMHGFLNVAISAALVYWQKVTAEEALAVLQESSIDAFQFRTDSISWKDRRLDISELEQTRQRFFRSFGSCSFQEPVNDLKDLKLL
ncbi:MAG: hypothetical protein AB4426_20415 [Xenococcaceae cyanobacterium]